MKILTLLCFVSWISFASLEKTSLMIPREVLQLYKNVSMFSPSSAEINEFTDKLLSNVDIAILKYLEPILLPNINVQFGIAIVGANISLSNGSIIHISTLHREGDAIITYFRNYKVLSFEIPIIFDSLKFKYHYNTVWMDGINPIGFMTVDISDMQIKLKVLFDLQSLKTSVSEFKILKAGSVDVHYDGNPALDWMFDLMSSSFVNMGKGVFLTAIEALVQGYTAKAMDAIVVILMWLTFYFFIFFKVVFYYMPQF